MSQELDALVKRWIGDLNQLGSKWNQDLTAGVSGYVDALVRDTFDPEKFMDFIRKSGVSFTGLGVAVPQQTAFDPYKIVGLDKSASDEEVKKRFRQMLHKYHPDTAGVEGTDMLFQIIMASYEAIKRERGWQ
jgi:hypothetical protein